MQKVVDEHSGNYYNESGGKIQITGARDGAMNFGERAAARKRSKNLKNELKELKKQMVSAGCDKTRLGYELKELQEALELGASLQTDYEEAGRHLTQAREAIQKLLSCMGESPASEVKESLKVLVTDLEQVYHDCSIREDDLDFQSTLRSLKLLVEQYSDKAAGMQSIMLRSELENVSAVLDDAAGWSAPDFLALAYYFLHEDRSALKEMENAQRNACVLSYMKEHFLDGFLDECKGAGVEETVQELIHRNIS